MKKQKNGFTLVELLVVIGILGILMGVLFPQISEGMLSANTRSMALRGRNLITGIFKANIEREEQSLPTVWPKSSEQLSDDTDDIAGQQFSDSAKYFEELFNIKKYGQTDWDPYLRGVDLGVLSGSGVPSFSGGTSLNGQNVAWCVAKGVTEEMEDIVPVLVTRNAQIDAFPTSGGSHDMSQDKTEVKIGKDGGGESDTPFGNKAFIVIRKGGSADVINAKYNKLFLVYKRQSFVIPTGTTFEYLKTGAK